MNLTEIGNLLKEERFRRGLYIEDAATKLKIAPRILRAIENGDITELPHQVYAKGFIKAYANYLGFSHEEIVFDSDLSEEIKHEDFTLPVQAKSNRKSKTPLISLFIIILAIIALFVYNLDNILEFIMSKQTNDETLVEEVVSPEPTSPVIEPTPSPMPEPVVEPEITINETPVILDTNPILNTTPIITPNPTPQVTTTPPVETVVENIVETTEAPVVTETVVVDETPRLKHRLIITADSDCWLRAKYDKNTKEIILRKGNSTQLDFDNKLELRLGNAGGVRLNYDGEDLGIAGSSAKVQELVFPTN